MNFNFELILFYATVITGLIALFDILFLAPRRKRKAGAEAKAKLPIIIDYARSFFPILLVVFLLRSFLFEPFRIPSGSLEPTLLMGDFILVNKYDYGVRLPVVHKKLFGEGKPARGDIIVFRWPPNPSVDFIKRVIGLPGDKISYINKELFVNGEKVPQEMLTSSIFEDENGEAREAQEKQENLLGVKHKIFIDPKKSSRDYYNIVVPEDMYFVMGDNRDDSADSRYWGFVPDKNIVGKAVLVWMSWDSSKTGIRWGRIGKAIH
ncbi:signal peptidase I [Aquicella lusitana]|uniref:Signal peptidase I n=1 Tax=Aquicella lusitana TaxID=254246 RepID=A0A370GFW7_9COXI|nr:signal peptidase I [Aquicella lusitana]RDI42695.1 signal peptidase I [Aquicella lusitana]VVC73450.1 Signal peptidase I [Aquicella lusitana]